MNYLMRLASRAAQSQAAAVFDASGASNAAAPRPSLRSESPLVRADQRLHLPELAAVAAVGQTDFSDVAGGEEALAMESASLQQIAPAERAPNAAPEPTLASSGAASIAPSVSPGLGAADVARLDVEPAGALERVVERRVEVVRRPPSGEVAPLAPADRISTGLASLVAVSPTEGSDGALHEVAAAPVAEPSMPPALARALEAAQAWLSQGTEGDERFRVSEAKPQPLGAPRFSDARPLSGGAADEPERPLGLSIGQIHVEVVSTPAPLLNAQKNNAGRPARPARAQARPPSWGVRQPFGWRQR
jgi:hypothetical protein